MPPPINFCVRTQSVCGDLLTKLACPSHLSINHQCDDMHDYSTFVGNCSCGSFNTGRPIELVIDSQAKGNGSNSLVMVWPDRPSTVQDPTQVFDYCLSYTVSYMPKGSGRYCE